MDLTLQQLRMLRELADVGTIAAAADSLGYTPSAVSQQLAALERAVGQPLLERVGRNVRLTDAGRVLVDHAAGVLDQLEAARAALEHVTAEVRGEVRLSVFESVAAGLLPQLLTVLGERHPDLRVRTRRVDPHEALDLIGRGQIDLGFTIDYPHSPAPVRDDVVRCTVLEDRFRLVVADDGPLRSPTVALSTLSGEPFIAESTRTSCGQFILIACRAAGFEPDVVHEIDDYPTALRLVANGHGVALVPDLGLRELPAGARVVDIEPPFSRLIQVAHRRASAERPAVQAVVDAATEVAAARRLRRVG